jgi:hypothetical protein
MIGYNASPTGSAFMVDRSYIKLIMGPVGGGKSTVAFIDLLNRAFQQVPFNNVRRTKFIILRNTMAQLKATVKPLIDQWMITMPPSPMGSWRLTDNTFEIRARAPDGTIVHTEFVMMAADTPDDVRRLLSVECSAAWVEEAREVDPEVFAGLQGRTARFPNVASGGVTYPGVICSTNPPPLGGFWHGLITKPPSNSKVFIQPSALLDDGSLNPEAENLANLDPDYYDNLIAANSDGWIDVYLKNKFGPGNMGQPVYKASFKRDFHVSKTELKPVMQSVNSLIVGMDNGLQAAAAIGQMDARGRVNVLDECLVHEDMTMGVESFLERQLVPLLREKYPFKPENIIFLLDPACFQRSQVDEKTIAQAVMKYGYTVRKAPTNAPERRISAVEDLFSRQIDGSAALLIDPKCEYLIEACDWGYRYKKSAGGGTTLTPDKTHHSHLSDAFQYFALHFSMEQQGQVWSKGNQARTVRKSNYVYV